MSHLTLNIGRGSRGCCPWTWALCTQTRPVGCVRLGDKTVIWLSQFAYWNHMTDSSSETWSAGCTSHVQYQLLQLHSNVPWLTHGTLLLRQRQICCFLFIMFRFCSCKLIVVGVYSFIAEVGFLLTRTAVFMILWLTNNSRHVDQLKLNFVLWHKSTLMSTTSCSTTQYPAWSPPYSNCSFSVNRHNLAPYFL